MKLKKKLKKETNKQRKKKCIDKHKVIKTC